MHPKTSDIAVCAPFTGQIVCRQMVAGGIVLATYGAWLAWGRLPTGLPVGTFLGATAWSIAIFAAVGMLIGATSAGVALLASKAVPVPRRTRAAAILQTVILVPAFVWLLLNEFCYSTTSQVIGSESILMLWATPWAVLEGAWEMGGGYLITTAGLAVAAGWVIYRLSVRSFQPIASNRPLVDGTAHVHNRQMGFSHRPSLKLTGAMTGAVAVVAGVFAWQFVTRPGQALTVLSRAAPPLRAFNLTRALIGIELTGPTPDRFAGPIISETDYQASMGTPRTPAPNVVFILLESVAAKALHCYGHHRADVSPNVDTLAETGTLFEHCVSPASFSTYSVVSVMTSLHMLRDTYNDHFADTSFPFISLPRALKLAGYELTLFSSGNEAFDNINHFCPPGDFDTYFSHDTCGIKKADCMRMDDQHAVGEFENWLLQRTDTRPFYTGFYLQSPHFNYEVPEPWFSYYQPVPPLYSNGDGIIHIPAEVLPLLKNQYDNSIRYADYWIGRIRAALASAGEFDNTIIVITADHGEAFMEHGLARHGIHLWEEMVHVPLIIHAGQSVRKTYPNALPDRVPETVSGIDIAPTLAGLIGIEPPPCWQGVDCLSPAYDGRNRPVFSVLQLTQWMEAVYFNKFKYVYDLTDIESHLFDLNTDPAERHDLAYTRPQIASALQSMLGAWHVRQLTYYAPENRPLTHYIGHYEPSADTLQQFQELKGR